MSFEQFVGMLQTKFQLSRALHTATGMSRKALKESIDELSRMLHACPNYEHYMDKVCRAQMKLYE